jgi:predicted ArsR family transcriptional regulator
MFGHDQPTDLQQDILALYDRDPNRAPKQIADQLDCSASYVRETIDDYRHSGGFL